MWDRKHLLGLENLSSDDLRELLDRGQHYRAAALDDRLATNTLNGIRVVLMFFENSTRTRVSFELAAQRLGAAITGMVMETTSVKKGESLLDTACTIASMGTDIMIVRHSSSGSALHISKAVEASIVNAGDGTHEHPTQALLDLLTIRQRKGKIEGLRVGIVGDILHSRVARSNIIALRTLGASVVLIGPPTLVPKSFQAEGIEVSHSFDDVIHQCDVINMLRIQTERLGGQYFPSLREYTELYKLDVGRMRRARADVLVMHPGPLNRGIEISPEIADGPNAAILEQVSNGVAVRMAVLDILAAGRRS